MGIRIKLWPVAVTWAISFVAYYRGVLWPDVDFLRGTDFGLRFVALFAVVVLALLVTAASTRIPVLYLGLIGAVALRTAIYPPSIGSHGWDSLMIGWSLAVASLALSLWGASRLRSRHNQDDAVVYGLLALQGLLVFAMVQGAMVSR